MRRCTNFMTTDASLWADSQFELSGWPQSVAMMHPFLSVIGHDTLYIISTRRSGGTNILLTFHPIPHDWTWILNHPRPFHPTCMPLGCLWITNSNISHLGRNLHVYAEQWNVDGGGRGNMSLANAGVDIDIWVKAVLCALPISGLAFVFCMQSLPLICVSVCEWLGQWSLSLVQTQSWPHQKLLHPSCALYG